MYADDGKISLTIDTMDDCDLLQEDLNILANFFDINKLKLNIEKNEICIISQTPSIIQFVYTINDTKKLTTKSHNDQRPWFIN